MTVAASIPGRLLDRRHLVASAGAVLIGVALASTFVVSLAIAATLVTVGAASAVALHRATGRGSFVSPAALVLGIYVVMAYVGALLPGRVARELPQSVRFRTAAMYLLGILAFAGFGMLTAYVMRFRPAHELAALRERATTAHGPANAGAVLGILAAVGIGGLVVTWLFFYNRTLPLGAAVEATLADPAGGRSRTILLDARLGYYRHGVQFLEQFRYGLAPFCNVALLFLGRRWQRRGYAMLGLALLPFTCVMLLGSGQRHPFASLLLFSGMILAYGAPRLFRRLVVPLGSVTLVVFWVQTFLLGRFDKTGDLMSDISRSGSLVIDRFVMTHAGIAYRTVELFRHEQSRLGRTWLNDLVNFIPFLPGKRESFTIELFRLEYGGTVGSASPVAPLEGYVNFGTAGPLVVGAFLGLVLTAVTVAIVRAGVRDPLPALDLLFLAYVAANAARAGYGGLLSPLQVGIIPVFVLWLLLRQIAFGRRRQPTGMSP